MDYLSAGQADKDGRSFEKITQIITEILIAVGIKNLIVKETGNHVQNIRILLNIKR